MPKPNRNDVFIILLPSPKALPTAAVWDGSCQRGSLQQVVDPITNHNSSKADDVVDKQPLSVLCVWLTNLTQAITWICHSKY